MVGVAAGKCKPVLELGYREQYDYMHQGVRHNHVHHEAQKKKKFIKHGHTIC